MHQEIVRRSTADNLRSGRSAQALQELIDLLLNGYACVFQLAQCAMFMRWIDFTTYDTTVAKALPKLLAKKMNLAIVFAVIRQNVISVVTSEMTKPGGMVFAHILRHMDHVRSAVQRLLHPVINDPKVTAVAAWSRASLMCRVNREIASETKAKNPYARLAWNTQDFEFRLNLDTVNKARSGRSLDGLSDEQRTALTMGSTKAVPVTPSTDTSTIAMLQNTMSKPDDSVTSAAQATMTKGRCFQCGDTHQAKECPKLSQAMRKALTAAERSKETAAKRAKAAARALRNPNLRKQQRFNNAQYVQQGMHPTMYLPQPFHPAMPAMHLQQQTPVMREQNHQRLMNAPNQQPMLHHVGHQHQAPPPPKRRRANLPGAKFYFQGQNGLTLKHQYNTAPVCYHFEHQRCQFAQNPQECRYPHYCRRCQSTGHGVYQCPAQNGPL